MSFSAPYIYDQFIIGRTFSLEFSLIRKNNTFKRKNCNVLSLNYINYTTASVHCLKVSLENDIIKFFYCFEYMGTIILYSFFLSQLNLKLYTLKGCLSSLLKKSLKCLCKQIPENCSLKELVNM